jgi:hypothetical protein
MKLNNIYQKQNQFLPQMQGIQGMNQMKMQNSFVGDLTFPLDPLHLWLNRFVLGESSTLAGGQL